MSGPPAPADPHYTFGDTEAASTRLRLLSDVHAPSTAAFVRGAVPTQPGMVVDLGCGPGHTTRLLASTLRPQRAIGLDSSPSFLAEAEAEPTEGVAFALGDVTALAVEPADVLYARFLLMHLPEPASVLARWADALAPGGRILAQESEVITTSEPAFRTYLDIVAGMLADNGNEIYLGPQLDAWTEVGPLGQESSERWRVSIPADVTARLYRLNVRSWRDRDYVRRNVSSGDLDGLDEDLAALESTTGRAGIDWDMRGVAFARQQ